MRVCPTCGARYEAPAQYCQRDGVPLRVEAEARDPYLGTKILGQFRLEKVVGSGGMGMVYAGWDEGLGRRVAVKILHRDLVANRDVVARFHREAQIAHQLDHPNIVRLILFGQLPDGNLYLVLEYLEGPTLLGALDRDGAMPPERAVKIASGVSDAIGYAHRRDIIHRDLKPENIMLVNRDGDADHPKVLDFGIAKMLIGGDTLVTQAGLIFGTARYISPEGAQGDPVDKRSDVYSLAIIAYQLLSGATPFDSAEPVQLLLKHIHEQPPALHTHAAARNVPPALEDVVMRGLAKSPAARYGDGCAFARALREALVESDPQAAIRSVVPTNSMPMYVTPSNGAQPSHGAAMSPIAAAQPQSAAYPGHAGAAAQSTMLGGSPGHGPSHAHAHAHAPTQAQAQARAPEAHAYPQSPVPSAGSGPYPSVQGSNAIAMPAVVRVAPTVAVPAYVPPPAMARPVDEPDGPRRTNGHAQAPEAPSASSATSPYPAISANDSDDDIDIPGLPRRKARKPPRREAESGTTSGGSPNRTVATIVISVIATLLIGATAAWALGLYPSQRHEAQIRDLLYRSQQALISEHYLHQTDENDVEDLTDAVIALDPSNSRARQIRTSAAVRLRNRAVELRNSGHGDQALPLLRSATRLVDDTEIRDLVTTIEREIQNPAPVPPTVAPPTPPPVVTPRTNVRPRRTNAEPDGPEPPPTTTTQPVQPTQVRPTFTPGRDPNQPANPRPPVVTPPQNPRPPVVVTPPPQNPPPDPMQGGPSQPDNPPPDPNGGVQF